MPARHHYSSTVIRTGLFKGLTSFSELEQRIHVNFLDLDKRVTDTPTAASSQPIALRD